MITFEEAKELFIYNRETGVIKWRKRLSNSPRQRADLVAGYTIGNGYTQIGFKGKRYYAHRIAMLLAYGFCSDELEIDHINHIRDDNRLSNLRFVTRPGNCRNLSKRSDSTSGVTGVSYCKDRRKYTARIKVDGVYIFLGRFVSLEEAIEARKAADIKYNHNTNHGNNKIKEYVRAKTNVRLSK
jgi:hypothetical protein